MILSLNDFGVTPEAFEVIKGASALGKDVYQEVAIIHQNPVGLIIAFDAHREFASIL